MRGRKLESGVYWQGALNKWGVKQGRRVETCSFTFISFYVSWVTEAGRVFYVSFYNFFTFFLLQRFVLLCALSLFFIPLFVCLFYSLQTVPPPGRIKIRRYFTHTETATLHAVKVYCLYLLQTAENGRFGICGTETVHTHLLMYVLLPLVTVSYWDGTEWLNSRKWSTSFLLAATEAAFSRPFRILPKLRNSFMVPARRILIAPITSESPNLQVNFNRKFKKKVVCSCE